MIWTLALALLALVGGALAFLLWAAAGRGRSEAVLAYPVEVVDEPGKRAPAADRPLRVISFNVAYCRGPKDDKGDLRDRPTIESYLHLVAEAIRRFDPDIAALQEVDFDSHRTHRIDQAKELARLTGLRFLARVPTWENNYVAWPFWPPRQHYGRMHSGQCVLSRFPIRRNIRYRLPQPASNPWWYNTFYLHRSVQSVDVDVGGRTLRVFNTHLEAFDRANREEQARLLAGIYGREKTHANLILGDMNAVPPEAAHKNGFRDEATYDGNDDSTVATLRAIEGLREIIPPERYRADEPAALTFPADAPTRRLDYFFFSGAFSLISGGVDRAAGPASDHLPVVAVLSWGADSPSD